MLTEDISFSELMHQWATRHANIAADGQQRGSGAKDLKKKKKDEPTDTLDGLNDKKNKEGAINKCTILALARASRAFKLRSYLKFSCQYL